MQIYTAVSVYIFKLGKFYLFLTGHLAKLKIFARAENYTCLNFYHIFLSDEKVKAKSNRNRNYISLFPWESQGSHIKVLLSKLDWVLSTIEAFWDKYWALIDFQCTFESCVKVHNCSSLAIY